MKKKFSKILGVGLALSLVTSLLLSGAPALADISQPNVSLDEEEISVSEEYTISFTITEDLDWDDADENTISVRFPEDTDIDNFDSEDWVAATAFALGDIVHDTAGYNGRTYECTTAGVTGGAEPAWDALDVGDEIADNAAEWTCVTLIQISATAGMGAAGYQDDDPAANVVDADDLTMEIDVAQDTWRQAIVELVIEGVINPPDPGTYTLEAMTDEEDDWVESNEYEIDAPTVGGFVYVYNDSNVLLATYGGEDALWDAFQDDHFERDDATIEVGEGTYVVDAGDLVITGEDLTLVSDAGAEDTIIDLDEAMDIALNGEGVTLDGFTIEDGDNAVTIDAEDVVVTNCVITDAVTAGIVIQDGAINAEVSNNVLEGCEDGIVFEGMNDAGDPINLDDVDIKDNEITECEGDGAIVLLGGVEDVDIKGNTITGNDSNGIFIDDTTDAPCVDINIEGNTISENDGNGIEIDGADAGDEPDELVITLNDILDNEDVGILIGSWTELNNYIMLNNIHGNDGNVEGDDDINARFNWWGTTDEDEIEDELDGDDIEYEPYLVDSQENVSTGFAMEVGDGDVADDAATSLDGRDDCGVNVSGMRDDDGLGCDIISAFQYAENPQDEIDDAIAFWDVFILLGDDIVEGDVSGKLKFYDSSIDEGSVASFWTGDFWAECSDQMARDGVVYVDLNEDTVPSFEEMEETPFVVTAGEAEEGLDEPVLLAPEVGDTDVSLSPAFGWSAVEDAEFYEFHLADNPDFVVPLVKRDDDLSALTTTAYAYKPGLEYSTSYYWRVKAVAGEFTFMSKDRSYWEEESNWVTGVFTTMDEPKEEAPPVVVEEAPPAPVIEPIVEVITPPAQPITPAWIYVIIGVGGVLVIALIVLIVRTRRVA